MTKEELDREAEDYRKELKEQIIANDDFERLEQFDVNVEEAYIAGALAHSVQWHDLEKDPTDLPKDYKTMCICLGDFGSTYQPVPRVCVGYCDSLGWSDYMGSSLYSTVRYWCELPKFEGSRK